MTNRSLKRWYGHYNRKYFQGRLPDIAVRFAKISRVLLGVSTRIGDEWVVVEISKELKGWNRLTRCILLHEMAHVSLPIKIMHGPKFEKEMRRIAKAGAFRGIW